MFVIRKEQLDVFSAVLLARFIKEAGARLRMDFPVQTKDWTDDRWYGFIRKGVETSARYGIIERKDVLHYLQFMISYGEDFDTSQPWAARILRVRNLSGKEKSARLLRKANSLTQAPAL